MDGADAVLAAKELKEVFQVVCVKLDIVQYLVHQSCTECFAVVDGNDGRPAVGVPHKMVAPFGANILETGALESREHLAPRDALLPAHTSTATR